MTEIDNVTETADRALTILAAWKASSNLHVVTMVQILDFETLIALAVEAAKSLAK